jgi:MCM OB domain/MCM P-loop domain
MPDSSVTNNENLTTIESNDTTNHRIVKDRGHQHDKDDNTIDLNDALVRLWKSHQRVLVDVKLSSDMKKNSNRAGRSDDNEETSKAMRTRTRKFCPPFSSDSYEFMIRLHKFFYQFLEWNLQQYNKPSPNPKNSNHNIQNMGANDMNVFLKKSSESTLLPFSRLAFGTKKARLDSRTVLKKLYVQLIEGRHVIPLHYEDFMNELNRFELKGNPATDEFVRKRSFGQFLYFKPTDALSAIGCSMALSIISLYQNQSHPDKNYQNKSVSSPSNFQHYLDMTQIVVRFWHVYPQIQMTDIKTGLVDKFVSIKGHVVKVRAKGLRLATADFACQSCNNTVSHSFVDGKFTFPSKCLPALGSDLEPTQNNNPCRSKSFKFLRSTARYIDIQQIRLQEAQDDNDTMQAGRTPRQVEVELTHDLVNACRPGDIILLSAIVTAINTAVAAGSKGKRAVQETSTYNLFLVGHSVTTMSESLSTVARGYDAVNKQKATSKNEFSYTQLQLRNIVQLCHADHKYFSLADGHAFSFDLLVRSLCPSIIGHHEVKAGLVLCLLGGTPSTSSANALIDKGSAIRSNSHILIVGDPGMGKSKQQIFLNA